ncbi:hypothetical protein [Gallaecimonas pentaromativorans]|uniref:Uncharacterized protein n=1 Tax=Gallaecimonas pentaromativorans TaxID=584787 RepID=A0A3N1PBE2_9GAMM|nr:hypothetical protein [Gallaecimonas pentaromativorans]ROQ28722.1 hypothetical protein EDC28_103316 [Gallaecimonas pentaromativorans]
MSYKLIDFITLLFGELVAKYKLRVSSETYGEWMHESVMVEGDSIALSFEQDNMSDSFYVNLLVKVDGELPNALSERRIINIFYLGKALGWSDAPQEKDDLVIWLKQKLDSDYYSIFHPSEELLKMALSLQQRDQRST